MQAASLLAALTRALLRLAVLAFSLATAYRIRLYAVLNFGRVIHEFDPWFNYRATEYLAAHGSADFFRWFDRSAWYPLGRPVGTTIYPGMQFLSVWIWRALQYFGHPMSLNDVCVFVPAWFGVVATAFLALLTYEGSGSADAAVGAAFIMAVIPAHIMRSVAGCFDNECVAVSALCSTFYLWCLSLRSGYTWPLGLLAGLSYFCMAATWGGYVYVLNMIGLHAIVLASLGRYSRKLHLAYSLFYLTGTALATQIPVVGQAPLRSLEQMGPLGVFLIFQILAVCEAFRGRFKKVQDFQDFRLKIFAACALVGALLASYLFQLGYFGPISSRVRGLFVRHTRTGNPLVDSVAEHQATSPRAYWMYLHYACYLGPLGFLLCFGKAQSDARLFLALYAGVTYHFSSKMNRLVLLLGPVASALSGMAAAFLLSWALREVRDFLEGTDEAKPANEEQRAKDVKETGKDVGKDAGKAKKKKDGLSPKRAAEPEKTVCQEIWEPILESWQEQVALRKALALGTLLGLLYFSLDFYVYCHRLGEAMSQPSIMFKSRKQNGEVVIVDDYRESYWWLRDNTPDDARVMAWWDYGYQINGVGNRTTIADGNTWNHEHIATLGRCLTSPEKQAHELIRHLADYVLIWTGGSGDDVAKSPHMARIANSVYRDMCPGDPTCRAFSMDREGNPSEMMSNSLLWTLHSHGKEGSNVTVDPLLFEEVHFSRHNLVRIYKVLNISQESRAWAADPANRVCDAPGSWYCQGTYPPGLSKLIEQGKAFQQLEDFNAKSNEEAEEYQKEYHARMARKR